LYQGLSLSLPGWPHKADYKSGMADGVDNYFDVMIDNVSVKLEDEATFKYDYENRITKITKDGTTVTIISSGRALILLNSSNFFTISSRNS